MYNTTIKPVAIHGRSLAVRQAAHDDNDDLHSMRRRLTVQGKTS